jgi:hypothetical protein
VSPTARRDDASALGPAPEREGRLALLHTALNARICGLGIQARLLKRKVADSRVIQGYLERHSVRSVQLGTGRRGRAGRGARPLLDPDRRRSLGESARVWAEQHLGCERGVEAFEQLYDHLAADRLAPEQALA